MAPELRAAFGLALGAMAAYGQSMPPADALPWLEEAEQAFARLGDGRMDTLGMKRSRAAGGHPSTSAVA